MPESSETEEITPETDAEEVESEETDKGAESSITKEEYDKLFARMQAADRNKSKVESELAAAQKKLEDIENSKLDEGERTKKELEAERSAREKAAEELNNLRLNNAFLTANVQWEDPEVAFAILTSKYMDGVEIGQDGKISGLEDAVKRLAKEKAYLTKKVVTPSSEVTGTQGNGKRKGEEEKVSKDKLAAKFPALKRR